MNPLTHLLANWIIAAKTTDNLRDPPDLDGLGILADYANGAYTSGKFHYNPQYHHMLSHGLPAAIICSTVMAVLARRHWRVFWLSFLTFHLHLLCDLMGSRGPDKNDLWPIYYFAPWRLHPEWVWRHQWPLDSWQNWVITMVLFGWALRLAVKMGDSFVGVINRRFDRIFVCVLQKWHGQHWPPTPAES